MEARWTFAGSLSRRCRRYLILGGALFAGLLIAPLPAGAASAGGGSPGGGSPGGGSAGSTGAPPSAATPPTPSASATVPITAEAIGHPALQGLQEVAFGQRGKIQGRVSSGASGVGLVLTRRAFPFTKGFAHPVTTSTTSGGNYVFKVSPGLATQYRVALASNPAVTSPIVTLYDNGFRLLGSPSFTASPGCKAPAPTTCANTVKATYAVPPSAAPFEQGKKVFLYVGVNIVPGTNQKVPRPAMLKLDTRPHDGATLTPLSQPGEFASTVSVSYKVSASFSSTGWSGRYWFEFCTVNSYPQDGFGLPYHYACGTLNSIPFKRINVDSVG